ncbi:MAG: hypothetical protein MMC23_002882 [Stictis urceolatum]|nr:hypothetical protein [Stictis urceolata]
MTSSKAPDSPVTLIRSQRRHSVPPATRAPRAQDKHHAYDELQAHTQTWGQTHVRAPVGALRDVVPAEPKPATGVDMAFGLGRTEVVPDHASHVRTSLVSGEKEGEGEGEGEDTVGRAQARTTPSVEPEEEQQKFWAGVSPKSHISTEFTGEDIGKGAERSASALSGAAPDQLRPAHKWEQLQARRDAVDISADTEMLGKLARVNGCVWTSKSGDEGAA